MKIYHIYFKSEQFQALEDTLLMEKILGTKVDRLTEGAQILTVGLDESGNNTTEFFIWSTTENNLRSLLNKEVINELTILSGFMESDLKKGVDETLKWLKENSLESREFFI